MSKSNSGNETADSSGPTEPCGSGVYRAVYDPNERASVSDTVIAGIADVADVDPTETVIPLSDRIDPDALDALFADSDGDAQVSFRVFGLEVFVRSDGHVRIVEDPVSLSE